MSLRSRSSDCLFLGVVNSFIKGIPFRSFIKGIPFRSFIAFIKSWDPALGFPFA